jgi:DNA polymerase III epsilon subunit-like protein
MIHDIYLDTETTGFGHMLKGTEIPGKHDVIQVAAILGDEQFEEKCQPIRWDAISQQALDVHGYQIDDLRNFQHSIDACVKFRTFLANNMTGVGDKYRLIAHMMTFDYKFMKAWFIKNGFEDWDCFFLPADQCVCTKVMGNRAKKAGLLPDIENMKLVTCAAYIDFEFDAHDALGDTLACKKWHETLIELDQPSEPIGDTVDATYEELKEPVKGTGTMVL